MPSSSGVLERIIEGKSRDLGGLRVRRMLPAPDRKMVGPFIFFDHAGPAEFEPGKGVDVRPHPHIGLATVTYLFDGELTHRDSLGYVQSIQPGAVNWMTAGRGIVHSERTGTAERARGAFLHGIQSWVALPLESEECDPSFVHYEARTLPAIERPGVRMRLIAGTAYGAASPVAVMSPVFYLDAALQNGASLDLPDEYTDRAIYVVSGRVTCSGAGQGDPGQLLVFRPNQPATLTAQDETRLMILGGEPLEGDRHIWWNFVSSTRERIEQAKADWQADRFGGIPGETERIPLPER